MDAVPQEPRTPMHLVTGHRAISAADAQVHIHHEQVCAINDARTDLFGGGYDFSLICWWVGRLIISLREVRKLSGYLFDQRRVVSQTRDGNVQHLPARHASPSII